MNRAFDGFRVSHAAQGVSGGPRGEKRLDWVSRLSASLVRMVFWPVRVLRARRELEMLAGLGELELKDIGLTRSDIGDATALPSASSPSDFLARRVEERYRARSPARSTRIVGAERRDARMRA